MLHRIEISISAYEHPSWRQRKDPRGTYLDWSLVSARARVVPSNATRLLEVSALGIYDTQRLPTNNGTAEQQHMPSILWD